MHPITLALRSAVAASALAILTSGALADTTYTLTYTVPTGDRWNYPFNPTPGLRPTASVFGGEAGSSFFDNRDGQMVVVFDTAADVPTGHAASSYVVSSARVTLQFASDLAIAYDPTTDPWQSFLLPNDPNYIEDRDPGQPIELFGTGFRNGWSLATWVQTSPYAPPGTSLLLPGIRNAYAQGFNGKGNVVDVSDNVRDQFTPIPFAIGTVPDVQPGSLIPINSFCIFDLAIDNPLVQGYLQDGVSQGRVNLSITSLAKVVQQGTLFPAFYCKENPLVLKGLAFPAKLELTVTLVECAVGDLDCDGVIGSVDLALLLGAWGSTDPNFDLSGNGSVGAEDLAILLGAWT